MPKGATGAARGAPARTKAKEVDLDTFVVPECPPDFGIEEQMIWSKVWVSCAEVLDVDIDIWLVEDLVRLKSEENFLRRSLKLGSANGGVDRVIVRGTGALAPHPYVAQLRDIRVQVRSAMASIGMTPADRARWDTDDGTAERLERLGGLLEQNRGSEV